MQSKIKGVRNDSSNTEIDLKATKHGALFIAPSIAANAIRTMQGRTFTAISTTAVAAIVDEPDTATNCILFNNSSNLYYIIERVFAYGDVSSTNNCRWAIWCCVQHSGRAADTAGITLYNNQSGALTDSTAIFDPTATAVNEGWSPWSNSLDTETAVGGLGGCASSVRVDGLMIIPPTGGLAMHVVGSHTVATFNCGAQWSEVEMDTGR